MRPGAKWRQEYDARERERKRREDFHALIVGAMGFLVIAAFAGAALFVASVFDWTVGK